MKPIIMDMREMSLSKEVYDSRPNIFFVIFIYGLLAMLIIALGWTCFGEIDIVVKASGIIRPNTQAATVTNVVTGEVTAVFYYDGQQVQRGDILYTVDSLQLESDEKALEEKTTVLKHELAALRLYKDSIEAGENLVLKFDEEYSARFESYTVNLKALEHSYTNDDSILSLELEN